ncbi:MAG: glycosyltransferase family 4 protein [Kofleriaceae bacterium]
MGASLTFAIPGDLAARTGGYEYDRRMCLGLRELGWAVTVRPLDASFPQPTDAALADAETQLTATADGSCVVVDGLALGAMPALAAVHSKRLRLIALVHHPLALENGLPPGVADRLRTSERDALACARHVIVTSHQTARTLETYDVTPDRVTVVEPGTEPARLARGSGGDLIQLVCVASISPRKGHAVLIEALAGLRDAPWRLDCVGSLDRDPETVRGLRRLIDRHELTDRVTFVGEAAAEQIGDYYDRSDVFVLPTLYEGYGMVVAEALARGLPVISTPTGAIADLVSPDAGILVAAGDVGGWREALRRVFDPAVRSVLARGARARRSTLPTWEAAVARFARVLTAHG